MRRSVATVSLSGTLYEKLSAAARAGFDGVELFEDDLIASPWSPAQIRRRADDLGLRIDLYQPFRDAEALPDEHFARVLRRAAHKFDVMEALGASTMLICSSVSPVAIDDDDLAAAQLRELAEHARARGLRIAYEALAWGRHVSDYRHAWRIAAAADHPALGTCIDSFHILSRGHDPQAIREIPGDRIFFLQLADAPELVMDVLQWSRHYRCFPGQGGFDLTTFVGHVLAAGYTGPLSLEVFNDVFRQADADRTAVDAMRSLLVLEESLRASAGNDRAGMVADLDLCAPPAPVEPTDFAFAEVAVDHTSAPGVERVLTALGFERSGHHRSKPVHMWTQGRARVLLNHGDARVADTLRGNALVSALALEVDDPPRSAARAEQLRAPRIARDHGPSEADLAAVSAPDGTAIFFCRTAATDAQSWVTDFLPMRQPAPQAPAGITCIDHVGLAQPFDHFDEALLFYRAVLGLRLQGGQELAAPYGLVRSRPLSSADGAVRIALSVALLGRGGSVRGAPEPQQIAFACDDIFAASRAVRAAGGELLPIPDNYYDDLAARTDLDDALVARMRNSDVLYDHTARGTFLHFYTPLIGDRLFFEVVQRTGAYDGYGAPNTPVRMAALRAAAQD